MGWQNNIDVDDLRRPEAYFQQYLSGRKTIQTLGKQYCTHLSYMPQDFAFYPDFTVCEFMLYMATVKGDG